MALNGRFKDWRDVTDDMRERFNAKVDRTPGHGPQGECWEWTAGKDKDGYGQFQPVTKVTIRAHRFAFLAAFGWLSPTGVVMHKCDYPSCVNPSHLLMGSQVDNQRDKVEKRRQATGEGHGSSKFTADQVREIRARCAGGESQGRLAREFGVRQCSISSIVRRQVWRHV